ncbi:predicted protein [Aspergillus terreus NIH2624]|uniref:Uncharacterized protein n=1 Tax=Aspergillus terreus (strain NIH 2624 / FGSC A1156) TaxID=341663 RepID=Q0CV49_ASPTN|nr:uncharacterized protein ATEG_02435 [Aspergillus terreus NIH2624]EAU37397.1 predicted protein [Aspergillus terreus NIH2624]
MASTSPNSRITAGSIPQHTKHSIDTLTSYLNAQETTMLLLRASIALSQAEDSKAEQLVRRALHTATNAPTPRDPKHVARCHYWLGHIAWFRNDLAQARECFRTALAEDGLRGLPEGHDIDEYLYILRRGVKYGDRDGRRCPPRTKVSGEYNNPRKRKQGEMRRRPEAPRRSSKAKPVPNKADVNQQTSSLQHMQFRFRMYPTELAPRSRPTKIFPEQAYEFLVPAEEWEVIRQRIKGKLVTMEFLKRERVRMWKRLQKL